MTCTIGANLTLKDVKEWATAVLLSDTADKKHVEVATAILKVTEKLYG